MYGCARAGVGSFLFAQVKLLARFFCNPSRRVSVSEATTHRFYFTELWGNSTHTDCSDNSHRDRLQASERIHEMHCNIIKESSSFVVTLLWCFLYVEYLRLLLSELVRIKSTSRCSAKWMTFLILRMLRSILLTLFSFMQEKLLSLAADWEQHSSYTLYRFSKHAWQLCWTPTSVRLLPLSVQFSCLCILLVKWEGTVWLGPFQ